jgi:hypothetical protein
MGKYDAQRMAHAFLLKHLRSQEPFTLAEFIAATGWDKPGTYKPHLSKHFKGLIENVEGGRFKISHSTSYRVTEAFRRLVSWPKFKQHVTQVRRNVTNYAPSTFKVLIYDFLMPLTNEGPLRITLDALFFKDTLLAKLKTIPPAELLNVFPHPAGQSKDEHLQNILVFIEDHFVGYSISHVDGRFRSGSILTQDEVALFQRDGERYLIDETTAVTRFIFPYSTDDGDEELEKIRFLFQALFVRSIIQLVNGEAQIWMLESGPERTVHIWRAPDDDDEETDEDDE